MLTLEQAIAHCHEKAEELKKEADYLDAPYGMDTSARTECLECAKEHEQLAGWLVELQERREADKWISVKDKLPDKAKKYLVQTEYDTVTLAFFEGDYFGHLNGGKLCVKYWQPLPEPYESEDK